MANPNNINISPGRITALWQLLLLSNRYERENNSISVHTAMEILLNSSLRGGGLPVKDGLNIGIHHKFLEIDRSGYLCPTAYSKDALLNIHQGDEPNVIVQRRILQRLISFKKDHWLINFNEDIEVFKISIPMNWLELLESAQLFDITDEDVVLWWKTLIHRKEIYDQEKRNEIGSIGEELTKAHEINRLHLDRILNPELFVIQVSKFSDKYGFDIKSIRGYLLKGSNQLKDQIQVEVKASIIENEEIFSFYISRNEWNKAMETIDSDEVYFFYCWAGVNLNLKTGKGPFIIPAKRLQPHIPSDNSSLCEWYTCRICINLKEFCLI